MWNYSLGAIQGNGLSYNSTKCDLNRSSLSDVDTRKACICEVCVAEYRGWNVTALN